MQLIQSASIYTVSRLTLAVREQLERSFGVVWLQGEISNFVAAASGHWYFSLKDARSQIRCAMFRGRNKQVSLVPKNGDEVLIRAKVSLYEPRGEFQLVAEQLEPAGEGILKQRFEQLKMQLAAEGLFATASKLSIPSHPTCVGVVTSASGAALHDILTVLERRNPTIKVILYPTLVQGTEAASQIADAIATASRRNECDLLIVGRGGGSMEDLWGFNEEVVARAIYACSLPVISAVGHEVDTTIADYVADLRAPTPSAAAETVSGDRDQMLQHSSLWQSRLEQVQQRLLAGFGHRVESMLHRLNAVHPQQKLQEQAQRLDELNFRLCNLHDRQLQTRQQSLGLLHQRLLNQSPEQRITLANQSLLNLDRRIHNAMQLFMNHLDRRLASGADKLHLVSPLATLGRGYSLSTNKRGKILNSVSELKPGESVTTRLHDGYFVSEVNAIKEESQDATSSSALFDTPS